MRMTVATDGVRGLFAGLPIMIVQTTGKAAIRFFSYDAFKRMLNDSPLGNGGRGGSGGGGGDSGTKAEPLAVRLAAGTLAGACEAALWVTPCERLKTLRQAQIGVATGQRRHGSWVHSAGLVLKEEGVAGLFRGLGPTVARNSGTVGVRFVLYDHAVTMLRARSGGEKQGWHALVSGAGVGAVTTIVNNPIDVIKSRMQVGGGGTGARIYAGTFDCVRSLLREEGPRAFMQGVTARTIKVSVGQAVIFSSYEQSLYLLRNMGL
jgi:hypothetical protein